MQVQVSVSLDPPLIPQDYFHCAGALALDTPVATATLCVTVRGIHTGSIKGEKSQREKTFNSLSSHFSYLLNPCVILGSF